MRNFCLVLAVPLLVASARGKPQDSKAASADDIIAKAARSSYGQDQGAVDSGVLAEVFGTAAVAPSEEKKSSESYGAPKAQVEDDRYSNCSYYKGDGYECVPYYLCRDGYIITDGGGIIDIRSGLTGVELDPESSKCDSYLEVCCRREEFLGQPPPTRAPTTKATTTTQRPTPAPFVSRCGRRNRGGIGVRIQNEKGNDGTQFGEWPHMCAVLRKQGEQSNLYVCGASLIAPGIALTGAHCVNKLDTKSLKVRCGEWDTQQTIEPVRHVDRNAKAVTIHPAFNPLNLQEYFALIHLEQDFILSAHIDTICLPDQYSSYSEQFLRDDCVATGWGKDKFGRDGVYQVILKQVEMGVVPKAECTDRLRKTRLGKRFNLDSSFMCAGGEPGKDTCKGDGGGPLVCPKRSQGGGRAPHGEQYVQAGIVAWGIGCGGNVPGVYANVSSATCFIDWATRCVEGQEVDFYGVAGCRRWAKRTYCQHQNQIADLKFKLESTTDVRQKGRYFRQLRKAESLLQPFADAVDGCQTGPRDLDCNYYDYLESEEFDLSGDARERVVKAAGKGAEEDDADDDEEEEALSSPRSTRDLDEK